MSQCKHDILYTPVLVDLSVSLIFEEKYDSKVLEIKYLRDSFLWSDYPQYIVDKYLKIFTNQINNINLVNKSYNVKGKPMYIGFDFKGPETIKFAKNICKLIQKYFGFIKCIPYYKKSKTLLSYFSSKIKDTDKSTNTGVYKISCLHCDKCYVGQTKRALTIRLKMN